MASKVKEREPQFTDKKSIYAEHLNDPAQREVTFASP
jgi:hypothetical protein